jgi:hypothetical protein
MITREVVASQLINYLNREITLEELIDWSEMVIIDTDFAPEDTDMLMEIVGYLGAADSPGFELTWEICYDFLTRLGSPVKVVPTPVA